MEQAPGEGGQLGEGGEVERNEVDRGGVVRSRGLGGERTTERVRRWAGRGRWNKGTKSEEGGKQGRKRAREGEGEGEREEERESRRGGWMIGCGASTAEATETKESFDPGQWWWFVVSREDCC